MKCPNCKQEKCRYIQRLEKPMGKGIMPKRTDFHAKCKKCNWEGEI